MNKFDEFAFLQAQQLKTALSFNGEDLQLLLKLYRKYKDEIKDLLPLLFKHEPSDNDALVDLIRPENVNMLLVILLKKELNQPPPEPKADSKEVNKVFEACQRAYGSKMDRIREAIVLQYKVVELQMTSLCDDLVKKLSVEEQMQKKAEIGEIMGTLITKIAHEFV